MSLPLGNNLLQNISLEDIRCIASFPARESKKSKLMQALQIAECDDEEDLRKSICIDYWLDNLMFPVTQGFHWDSVQACIYCSVQLLNETACIGLTLDKAVEVFRSKLQSLRGKIYGREIKSYMDYVFDNFFQNYKLYLFCMREERQVVLKEIHVTLDPPPTDVSILKTGVDIETWNIQQKIKDIEKERDNKKEERAMKLQQELTQLEEEKLDTIARLNLDLDSLEEKDLTKILHDIAKSHTQYTETELHDTIEESKGNMDFDIKKGLVKGIGLSKGKKSARSRSKTPRSKSKMKASVSRLAP